MNFNPIEASFGPCDHLNPGFGYQVFIRHASTGAEYLNSSRDPVTGAELHSPQDCIRVINYYAGQGA